MMPENGQLTWTAPLLAVLELTAKCNLRCRHCSFFAISRSRPRDMPLRKWKRIIDILVENGCERATLSGGEPTLYRQLPEVIAYCKRKNLYTVVTTNGMSMSRAMAEKLVKAGTDYVQVSLDGLKEQHEALRGSGTYERAVRALGLLSDAGAHAGILCVLSTLNDRSIPEFVEMLTSLNIRDIGFERLTPLGRSSRLNGMALSPNRLKRALQTIYLFKKQHPESEINVNDPLKVHMDPQVQRISRGKHSPTGGCFAGGLGCTISPNGDLRPCTRLAYTAGNLLKADFSAIWNDSSVLRTLRDRRKWGRCGACRYRDACGGCRAESLASHGNMFACDPGCWLTAKERSRAKDKGAT